jgi:hypothetical protein
MQPQPRSRLEVRACSICLRAELRGEWREAEEAIRELHTYQQPTPPRLLPGLCDACQQAICYRRSDNAPLEDIAA